MRRIPGPAAVVLATGLVLAGCGTDEDLGADDVAAEEAADDPSAEDAGPDATDDADAADEADGAAPDGPATVMTAETALGEVLVDGDGLTLYMFDPDEQGPSTCDDNCAASWPPLLDDDPTGAEGVDAGLLGTVERDDGSLQVTYDDWPLYHWAGDAEPGDVEGQGVQGVWWVLAADGTPLRDAAEDEDEDEGDGGGMGY